MMIFLILVPYGTFTLLMLVTSASASLFTAAAVGLAVIAHDVGRGRSVKLLGAGSVVLFGALGCYLMWVDSAWSALQVKLAVDAGVLAISLVSLAIRSPLHAAICPRGRRSPKPLNCPASCTPTMLSPGHGRPPSC